MARFRLISGPVPLHHQVYLDLRAALDAGEWRPGDRLPTERDLAERYGCSLITVRRALGDLARERRLERTRGRGTFVTRPPIQLDLEGTRSFADEVRALGHEPSTRVVTCASMPADAPVADALGIGTGEPVIHVERLRLADGEPLLLEQAYLSEAAFPGLAATDLEGGSLYGLLESRFGTIVTRARESFEPVSVPLREAGLLGMEPHRPALRIEGVAFDAAGRPVEFSRSYVRGDRTRYYVERDVSRGPLARPATGTAGAAR